MDINAVAIHMACAGLGVNPSEYTFRKGAAAAHEQNPGAVGRAILKTAHEIMCFTGRGATAAAFHLDLITKSADWHPQFQETADTVIRALIATKAFQKQAFHAGDLTAAVGSLAKGVGYGSLGAGAGAGSLYWLLSRHAKQDDADIAAKQQQLDYYNQLSSEIQDAMNRKYQYAAKQPAKRPYRPR